MKQKIPSYEFLRFYIHCTSNVLFCISAHVREAASTNVVLILYNRTEQQGFIPWMNQFLNESSEPVIQRSIQMVSLVSFLIESAVLNKLFDMNDSVSHLLKQGLSATYWRFHCHIYLSMTDINQPRCQHNNTCRKILFNDHYWPKFSISGPRRNFILYK